MLARAKTRPPAAVAPSPPATRATRMPWGALKSAPVRAPANTRQLLLHFGYCCILRTAGVGPVSLGLGDHVQVQLQCSTGSSCGCPPAAMVLSSSGRIRSLP